MERGTDTMKKLPAMLLAVLLAGNTFLCSCTAGNIEKDGSTPEETTAIVSETTTEATTVTAAEAATASETTKTAALTGPEKTPYKQITLDGVEEHHFISEDFCFIESENCVFFLEKDIDIPGDYVNNIELVIGEIEDRLGISCRPESYNYTELCDMSSYFGFNPWKGWNIGSKLPVFLCVDRNEEGLIPCACADFVVIVQYELFSDELWNSIPGYRDNEWRRRDYIDYAEAAHEITHAITSRNCTMSSIMTEGIAEYMQRVAIDDLADISPAFATVKEKRYLYDYSVPEAVNAGNAERVFIEDYNQIEMADRGAEYVYGRYMCEYLNEHFGSDFYLKYNNKVIEESLDYAYGNYSEELTEKYAGALKDVFGEDIFEKFGDWCVANNALQE